ncbi:MAG: hypothetical protein ACT4PI_07860 [Actinomycetota bacterium]
MSDTRDQDRLDADAPKREDGEAKTEADEPSSPRHAEGSLDIFNGSAPERAALPDDRPWLAPETPGGGPRENVDPRANTPEGHEVERNLTDLNDGFGKDIPAGTNHHGVGTTYDQDKKVGGANDIDEVLKGAKPGSNPAPPASPPRPGGQGEKDTRQTLGTAGGSEKGSGSISSGGVHGNPPPGVELGTRAPKWDLVADDNLKGLMPNIFAPEKKGSSREEQIQKQKEALGGTKPDAGTPVIPEYVDKKKKMTDPDADPDAGGTVVPATAEEAAAAIARQGGGGDPINPDDYTAPEIDDSQPPADRYSKVRDPNPDDDGTIGVGGTGNGTTIIPGGGFTDGPRPDLDATTGAPPMPTGGGQGGGGQPDGRGGAPEVVGAAPAEAAPPAAAEPAPAPTVDQQLAPPDFDGPPAQGAPDPGEAGDGDPDGDGLPG